MQISVVIPTCDRKSRLLALLASLEGSAFPVREVIVVDSGVDRLDSRDIQSFPGLGIVYVRAEKSVCIQRNTGIRLARSPWVFLCDDDIEVPADYLQKLVDHVAAHPGTGALSGLFLQKDGAPGTEGHPDAGLTASAGATGHQPGWTAQYPLRSARLLVWRFIFQQSIWGEIEVTSNHPLIRRIKTFYEKRGNHISRAGWPVLTQFSAPFFDTPLYSLGAALVRKDWLLAAPFDEVLDRFGMGDNYGVAVSIPGARLSVLTDAFVYHHKEPANRIKRPVQYFRRVLALDYFTSTKETLRFVSPVWLLWSLIGNALSFIRENDRGMMRPAFLSIWMVAFRQNPYRKAARAGKKVLEPEL